MKEQLSFFIWTQTQSKSFCLSPEDGWNNNCKYEIDYEYKKINDIIFNNIQDYYQINKLNQCFQYSFHTSNIELFIYHYEIINNIFLFYAFQRDKNNDELKRFMIVGMNKNNSFYPKHQSDCKSKKFKCECKCYVEKSYFLFIQSYSNHLKNFKYNFDNKEEISDTMKRLIKKKKFTNYPYIEATFVDFRCFL